MRARTLATVILAAGLFAVPVRGDDPPKKTAWNLDEVLDQLAHHPKDPYLQYVALMLGIRDNREREVEEQIDRLNRPGRFEERAGRRNRADLFSTFTGAPAIQESLQLDTMRGNRRGGRGVDIPKKAADPVDRPKDKAPEPPAPKKDDPPKTLQIDKLIGPAQKPHPWAKMLGDKKPEVGP